MYCCFGRKGTGTSCGSSLRTCQRLVTKVTQNTWRSQHGPGRPVRGVVVTLHPLAYHHRPERTMLNALTRLSQPTLGGVIQALGPTAPAHFTIPLSTARHSPRTYLHTTTDHNVPAGVVPTLPPAGSPAMASSPRNRVAYFYDGGLGMLHSPLRSHAYKRARALEAMSFSDQSLCSQRRSATSTTALAIP